jgi:hypothetical protein
MNCIKLKKETKKRKEEEEGEEEGEGELMKASHLQNNISCTPHETQPSSSSIPKNPPRFPQFFLHFQLLVATNLRSLVEQLVVVVVVVANLNLQ